jgi:hypothetical protein
VLERRDSTSCTCCGLTDALIARSTSTDNLGDLTLLAPPLLTVWSAEGRMDNDMRPGLFRSMQRTSDDPLMDEAWILH